MIKDLQRCFRSGFFLFAHVVRCTTSHMEHKPWNVLGYASLEQFKADISNVPELNCKCGKYAPRLSYPPSCFPVCENRTGERLCPLQASSGEYTLWILTHNFLTLWSADAD